MARRSDLRITKRTVDSLAVEDKDAVFWDHDLPRFVEYNPIPLI